MSTNAHEHRSDDTPEVDRLLARAVAGDAAALDEIRARGAHEPGLLEELALWQGTSSSWRARRARSTR
jgi:hypothetical protein